MSVDIGTISGTITLNDQFVPVLDNAAERLRKFGSQSTDSSRQVAAQTNQINESYRRLISNLDPVVSGQVKYQNAHQTLSAAIGRGIITQDTYNSVLDKAKQKWLESGEGVQTVTGLLGKLVEMSRVAGPATEEVAEKVSHLAGSAKGLGSVVGELGPLAAPLLVLVAALGLVAAGFAGLEIIKSSVEEGMKFQAVVDGLNQSLRTNGAAAGLSAHELIEMADGLATVSGRSKESIVQGDQILTRFSKIGRETFPQAARSALDLAQATGKDLPSAFTLVGKALQDPTRGLMALKEVGITFRADQKAALAEMVKNGETLKYQGIILDALKEHVGGAAEAYGQTLAGQIAVAGQAGTEFKEGIASEVIPALQFLFSELANSAGGWQKVKDFAKDAGHFVGDTVREMVYGVVLLYHDLQVKQDDILTSMNNGFKRFADTTLDIVSGILSGISRLSQALGGPSLDGAIQAISRVKASIDQSIATRNASYAKDALDQLAAEDRITKSLIAHKQALEGDTETQKKHGSVVDDVAGKEKAHAAVLESAQKAVRAYAQSYTDLLDKLDREKDEQASLLSAIGQGIIAYNLEKAAQERTNAVTQETLTLTKAHRAEIDKLTTARAQLIDKGQTADAAKITAEIDAETAKYEREVVSIAKAAGEKVDLKQATDAGISADARAREFTDQLSTAQAALADAVTGTTTATKENATQLDIEKARIEASLHGIKSLSDAMVEEIRLRHQRLDTIREETEALRTLSSLHQDAEFQVAVSKIDSTASTAIQELETRYLSLLRDLGRGSLEEGQRQLDRIQHQLDQLGNALGVSFGSITDIIKSDLQEIQDAALATKIKGGGKSALSIYQEERDAIVRLMTDSSSQVRVSVADGNAAVLRLTNQFLSDQLSAWGGALDYLSANFGGFFTKLDTWIKGIQAFQSFVGNIGTILSGFGITLGSVASPQAIALTASATALDGSAAALISAAGALSASAGVSAGTSAASGAVSVGTTAGTSAASGAAGYTAILAAIPVWGWIALAIIAVITVVANWVSSHSSTRAQADIALRDGKFVLDNLKGAKEKTGALANMVTSIDAELNNYIASLNLIVTNFTGSLGVTRSGRNRSNEFRVYADGLVKNFGRDADAAMQDAFYQALADSTLAQAPGKVAIDPLVVAAIHGAAKRAADSMVAGITDEGKKAVKAAFDSAISAAREIANLGQPDFVVTERQTIQHLEDLKAALLAVVGPSEELIRGLHNIGMAEIQMWQSERDQLTGHQQTAAERLAQQQQNAKIYNAEKALEIARLQQQLFDLQTQRAYLIGKGQMVGAGANLDEQDLKARKSFLQAKGAILTADVQIESAALQLIDEQIAAINTIIDALKAIPDIDLSEIKLPKVTGAGGIGSAASSLDSMNQELEKLSQTNLPPAVQAMFDLRTQLADITKRAHEARASETLLLLARQALIDQAKRTVRDTVSDYLLPSAGGTFGTSAYDQAVRGIEDKFAEAAAAEQKLIEETGQSAISFRELEAAHLAAMNRAAEDMLDSLNLPVRQSRADVTKYATALEDIGKAAKSGSVSLFEIIDAVHELSSQAALSVINLLASILEQEGKFSEADKIKRAADELNFHIQLIQLNTLYNGYVALGLISGALKKRLDDLIATVNDPKNWPDFTLPAPTRQDGSGGGRSATPGGNNSGGHWVFNPQTNGWTWVPDAGSGGSSTNPAQAARDLLQKYQDQGLDPLTKSIRDINKDFQTIISSLGRTPDVIDAYNAAIQKAIDSALQQVRDLRRSLDYGPSSTLDPRQQLASALSQFLALRQKFEAGDLSTIQDIPQAVQQLLDLARQVAPVGSDAYAQISDMAKAFLDEVGSLTPAQTGPPLGTSANPTTVSGMDSLVVINTAQVDRLERIDDSLGFVLTAINQLSARTSNTGLSNVA